MIRLKITIIISALLISFHLKAEEKDTQIDKIPAHVFLFENLFIPGAGHIYNDHLGLAFWSFFGTIEPLIFSKMYSDSAGRLSSDKFYATEPSLTDVQNRGGQKSYLDNREYRYNVDISNSFLFLSVLNYLDSFIESYYAANKGLDENLNYTFGANSFVSAIKTRAIINNSASIASSQDAQMSAGLSFTASYGRIFEKEFLMHLGPHLVISYDYMFPVKVNRWLAFFVGNHFDMQKKAFSLSLNAPWTSYDRYMLFTDVIGIGVSVKPVRWMDLKTGVGVFTLSTAWQSFSDGTDQTFAQAHAGKTGLFTTTYVWGNAKINLSGDFFIGGRFKYISSREPQPNYNASTSYIDFIRLEAIVGVSF